jgi:hypothetical protein
MITKEAKRLLTELTELIMDLQATIDGLTRVDDHRRALDAEKKLFEAEVKCERQKRAIESIREVVRMLKSAGAAQYGDMRKLMDKFEQTDAILNREELSHVCEHPDCIGSKK